MKVFETSLNLWSQLKGFFHFIIQLVPIGFISGEKAY